MPVDLTIEDPVSTQDIEINNDDSGNEKKQKNEHVDKKEHNVRIVQLYYTTTDVKVSRTSLRLDVSTFISNVGGSLGLFIGFSFLGVFYFIYDFISSKFY